jgi:hypothetical protein
MRSGASENIQHKGILVFFIIAMFLVSVMFAFMVWCSVRAQGQPYLYFTFTLYIIFTVLNFPGKATTFVSGLYYKIKVKVLVSIVYKVGEVRQDVASLLKPSHFSCLHCSFQINIFNLF